MRNKLETEIINTLFQYRHNIPFEDIKAQITIILSNYEIEARHTEIAIRDEDKNNMCIAMFLASKAAGGRTERLAGQFREHRIPPAERAVCTILR